MTTTTNAIIHCSIQKECVDDVIHDKLLDLISTSDDIGLAEIVAMSGRRSFEINLDGELIFVTEDSIIYKTEKYTPEFNVLYHYIDMELNGGKPHEETLEDILEKFK